MNIKNLIKNPTFKKYFYYVTLSMATYSLVTDSIFLSKLTTWNKPCPSFGNNKPLVGDVLQRETNIENWDTSDTNPYYSYFFPENAIVLDYLTIRRGNYVGSFHMFNYGRNEGFKTYAGVVGTANTSPLITIVAAADDYTASYFFIRKGEPSLGSVCQDIIPNCFATKQINFPFTAFNTKSGDDVIFYEEDLDNSTFNIYPDLQLYVCKYTGNFTNSYSWARKFGKAVGIILLALESL